MYSRVLCLLCAILIVGTWVVVTIDEGQAQPSSVVAWNSKGIVFASQGKYDEAIKAYNEAIRLDPNYAEAWANLGVAYSSNNSYNEAIKAFDKSLSIDQKQGWVWYAKGSAYYKLGRNEEAIVAYDKAISLNKTDVNAWADKGYALYKIGNYEKAIQAFDESISIDPTQSWVWNGKGSAYYKLGDYSDALAAYDEAIKVGPNGNVENPHMLKDVLEAKIVDPQNGQTVLNDITVHGTIKGEVPADSYLWLLVGEEAVNNWWPQGGGLITPIRGEWSKKALIGGGPDLNIGIEQQMIVILVDEKVHRELNEWVETGIRTNDWPGIGLPSGEVLDKINVVKGKG